MVAALAPDRQVAWVAACFADLAVMGVLSAARGRRRRRGVTRSDAQVVVPNGQIMGVPLVNFSRMRWGQYKTELRLRLEDVSRVEQTIANLKEALAPHVITNGRNLWVHWRRIDKDALVVVVDVKLPYPGGSTAYYDAVGQCNVLIAKAIQDAGAELCLPTSRRVDVKK